VTDGPEEKKVRAVGIMLVSVLIGGLIGSAMVVAVMHVATR
jgi:hypothetical protein